MFVGGWLFLGVGLVNIFFSATAAGLVLALVEFWYHDNKIHAIAFLRDSLANFPYVKY